MQKLQFGKQVLVVLVALGFAMPMPLAAQQIAPEINDRLAAIEQSIRGIERRLEAIEGGSQSSSALNQTADLAARLTSIDQQIAAVEEQRKQAVAAQATSGSVVVAGREGFAIRSGNGAFAFNLRGSLQADSRFFTNGSPQPGASTLTITKVRPTFEGTLFKNFAFKMMPEFGSGTSALLDGYIDATIRPWLKLRAGKFKGPVGLERLVSDTEVEFYERFLPTNLVPNRDTGAQLYGDLWGGVASYAAGIFNGASDGGSIDLDIDNKREFEGRVFFHPFRKSNAQAPQGLGIGLGGSSGNKTGTTASPLVSAYRTTSQVNFFRYRGDGTLSGTVVADGAHTRITPQAYYYWGPFGAWGEYVASAQEIRRSADAATMNNSAWQIAATYVLTGEKASYRGVTPLNDLNIRNGIWGAFEIGARYGQLSVDRSAFPLFADPLRAATGAKSWTAGLNWYANRNVKFILNFERTNFQSVPGAPKRKQENAVLERFQLAF